MVAAPAEAEAPVVAEAAAAEAAAAEAAPAAVAPGEEEPAEAAQLVAAALVAAAEAPAVAPVVAAEVAEAAAATDAAPAEEPAAPTDAAPAEEPAEAAQLVAAALVAAAEEPADAAPAEEEPAEAPAEEPAEAEPAARGRTARGKIVKQNPQGDPPPPPPPAAAKAENIYSEASKALHDFITKNETHITLIFEQISNIKFPPSIEPSINWLGVIKQMPQIITMEGHNTQIPNLTTREGSNIITGTNSKLEIYDIILGYFFKDKYWNWIYYTKTFDEALKYVSIENPMTLHYIKCNHTPTRRALIKLIKAYKKEMGEKALPAAVAIAAIKPPPPAPAVAINPETTSDVKTNLQPEYDYFDSNNVQISTGTPVDINQIIINVIANRLTGYSQLLNTKINFNNKKKSIKDILISKFSQIFASGEFDKDDAENFIKFILASLTALHYENIPKTTRNLLFSNYLKAILKITPSELNKLLLDINNISELSNNVIKHFINRLTNNQKSVSDQDDKTPAAVISKLNFALKSNVQAFTKSIVYITLHSEQMVGSEEKVEEYLDNEYNKAMKLPTGEDQGRISNFELKSALNSILGDGTNTIKGYKEKIQKIDSHIDSINAKNIATKLQTFNTVFSLGKLENGTIIYNLPAKISGNLKAQETEKTKEATLEASSKEKLNQAVELLKEMLASSKDTDSIQKQKQKLEQFLTSLKAKDEE